MNLLEDVNELIHLSGELFDEINWENYEEAKVTVNKLKVNLRYIESQLEGS